MTADRPRHVPAAWRRGDALCQAGLDRAARSSAWRAVARGITDANPVTHRALPGVASELIRYAIINCATAMASMAESSVAPPLSRSGSYRYDLFSQKRASTPTRLKWPPRRLLTHGLSFRAGLSEPAMSSLVRTALAKRIIEVAQRDGMTAEKLRADAIAYIKNNPLWPAL